jgi:F-type H+-transporting ATPase subunit b
MKIPVRSARRRTSGWSGALACALAVVLIWSVGAAVAASGEGHGQPAAGEEHGQPAAGQEAAGHAGAEGHGTGWVKTDTYRVLNFAVLAIALVFLLRKPFSQALNGRIKGIQEQLADLEARKASAEKQLAEYNRKFALLDQEAEKLMADYLRQGQEAKARILQEAEAAADKLKTQARRSIDNEINRAKERLQAEVIEAALVRAEELIKRKITTGDQEQLVDEYLKKVVA